MKKLLVGVMFFTAALVAPQIGMAGRCPTTFAPKPFDRFFSEIQNLRDSTLEPKLKGTIISNFFFDTEYFKSLPGSLQFSLGQDLADPTNSKKSVRQIVESALKRHKFISFDTLKPEPNKNRLADLEKTFDPKRVVEIDIDPKQVKEIKSGEKTVTVRLENRWEYKSGPGQFNVVGTLEKIPINIEKVKFRQRLFQLEEEDLIGQGPLLKKAFQEQSKYAAMKILGQALKGYYEDFDAADDDLTVVHFSLRTN